MKRELKFVVPIKVYGTKEKDRMKYEIPWYKWFFISKNWDVFKMNEKWEYNLLKKNLNSSWYERVNLIKEWKSKQVFVHRILAEIFIEKNWFDLVNHIDGNRLNNSIENLEWTNKSWNYWHAVSLWKIKKRYWDENCRSKKVKMINSDWTFKVFDSIWIASMETWIDNSWISKVCRWKRNIAGWLKWEFI